MRRKNIVGTLVCSILLIGLTLYLAPSILPSPLPVKASSKTISLVATTNGAYYYWNSSNPTITVTQGDTLTIDVSSSNSVAHRLLIDLDNDGYTDTTDCGSVDVCSNTVPPSYTIPPFTINSDPGTYTYYCTIHPTSMFGSFVILSPTSSVPDFTILPSATSLTAAQGSSATATITLTSVNGFSGSVTLASAVSPFWSPTISEPRLDQLVGWGLCLIDTNNFHIIPQLLFDSGCSRKLCGERDSVKRVPFSFNDRVAGCWIDKHVTTRFFKPSSATDHRRNDWSYCCSWGRRVSDKTQKVTLAALSRPDLFWTTRGCSALGYSPKLLITLPEFPSITRTILVPL